MSSKTVRMDAEDEALLDRIQRQTGWTASDVLKRGLRALHRDLAEAHATRPFDIYSELDLGPGGSAAGPASQSRETARRVIVRKYGK